jgi:hypothetical protein
MEKTNCRKKICKKCLKKKSIKEFGALARSKDGRSPVCKKCRSKYQKKWKARIASQKTETFIDPKMTVIKSGELVEIHYFIRVDGEVIVVRF